VPRNRTVRLAVLGSSVQRAAGGKYPSRAGAVALKRRAVVGVLVLLSLLMITLYFRESPSGGLHGLQGAGATALKPFQVAAERVASPFRDAYGYFAGLVEAKDENARLKRELERQRQIAIQNETARQENAVLKELLGGFRAVASYPGDFRPVSAAIIAHAPTQFEQQVTIAAGLTHGVRLNDPVINGDGLVGRVTNVTDQTAQVTLLTDESSAVSAVDLDTAATGLVRSGSAGSGTLIMDDVEKRFVVRQGDQLVTAGSQRGQLPSLYPRGIPIGEVSFVGQSDTDLFKRIQVEPFVEFGALDSVIVLTPRRAP
jgi:rod shape-determining protein MreC